MMLHGEVIRLLDQHIPSLSDEDEQTINGLVFRLVEESLTFSAMPRKGEVDVADFALRTCMCGKKIDGFYGYVDHLKEVFG
jgi:hypothetical protein